jgi:hypothetical protein
MENEKQKQSALRMATARGAFSQGFGTLRELRHPLTVPLSGFRMGADDQKAALLMKYADMVMNRRSGRARESRLLSVLDSFINVG